jgi:hypothetical protein
VRVASVAIFERNLRQEVATDQVRKGEIGCLFVEIQNLVEPIERSHKDVGAGPQRGRIPERRGRARSPDSRMTRLGAGLCSMASHTEEAARCRAKRRGRAAGE